MKWRNSYAVVAGCAVVGLTAFNAQAQSAFAGFMDRLLLVMKVINWEVKLTM